VSRWNRCWRAPPPPNAPEGDEHIRLIRSFVAHLPDDIDIDTRTHAEAQLGYAIVREPIMLRSGYSGDDYVRNVTRLLAEERINLAITRPPAICNVTGLPTS
jgi:hypothetical protein